MGISYKEIRNRIRKLWPDCKNIWLNDYEYEYPTEDDVRWLVKHDKTERIKFRGYRFDCDDFALQLCASVSREVGQNVKLKFNNPIPFGQVKGHSFKHQQGAHVCNICLLEEKILIIEPQTDLIREADGVVDKIFFVGIPA